MSLKSRMGFAIMLMGLILACGAALGLVFMWIAAIVVGLIGLAIVFTDEDEDEDEDRGEDEDKDKDEDGKKK
ncbi:MAG: hypothetical protein ACI4WV_03920 [Eubacteriales bacterium]